MDHTEILFRWNGLTVAGKSGDTVASALYRSGVRTFTHSYQHGRPRGLLCLAGSCPNCMVNVDGVPNVRSCTMPARSGLTVLSQNQNVYRGLDSPAVKRFPAAPALSESQHHYEHAYLQFDAVVVGGGQHGLEAALASASRGMQVALLEKEPALGGYVRSTRSGTVSIQALMEEVLAHPLVTTFVNCSCFGLYEGNLLGAVQVDFGQPNAERLLHLRAGSVIVATGVYETQFLFANNDLPGVMLSTAVLRLLHQHAIVPGKRAVLIGDAERCGELQADLESAGLEVVASVPISSVVSARGEGHVSGLVTITVIYKADLVVMCGPLVPDVDLLAQAGSRLRWNEGSGAFLAEGLPSTVSLVGAARGDGVINQEYLPPNSAQSKDAIACLCMDVSGHDVVQTIEAGMGHIELIKRYTKLGKSACQGRMCQMAAVCLSSHASRQTIAQVGTTVARPPAPPVTLGALAGMRHHPVRRTPMHEQHDRLGAVWMDMGEWKRPRYYDADGTGNQGRCVEQEYRAVRERAGVIDVSTLGKIEVKGRDAGRLLDKVFTHKFSTLPIGRVRYSVLCDELGTILDDGTISRMDEQHYFLTTTTGNVDFVHQWLEWWVAAAGWKVTIVNLTAGLASMNLAGPLARGVLEKLTDCDLSSAAFPYMDWRRASVAAVPATMMRIGFVGETGWEIVVAAEYGIHLWNQVLQAGSSVNLLPFGVESQRVLRLEKKHIIVGVDTDGLSNPYEAGMAWVAKLDKADFIGKVALARIRQNPLERMLVGFELEGSVVPPDGSPVLFEGSPVGWATSVRFSWEREKVIGLAWVTPAEAKQGTRVVLRSEAVDYAANIVEEVFYDPTGQRLRA
jgi:sarcosine oxidase subunit alpha